VIVTRQRRKPFPWKRFLLPVVAIALVLFALWWAPSRSVVTAGPLAPAWQAGQNAWNAVAAPFHFAAQNQAITDRNRQIAALQTQLANAQNAAQGKDKQIASLQQQIDQLESQAAAARGSAGAPRSSLPRPAATESAFAGPAGVTPDVQKAAQYWTSMDPENAAKVARRLPPSYVARVFAQMQPDAVGAILDALPPAFAAKLTQEHPDIQH